MVFHQGTPTARSEPAQPAAIAGCLACDLSSGRVPLPGGIIHRRSGWVVEHCVGPLDLGTLIVKPERHVTHVADLIDQEAIVMGQLIHRATRIVTELANPDQVYVSLWSHSGGRPGHIHYVVQPIARTDMNRHGGHGPKLQAAMFEAGISPAPELVEAFARRARAMWDRIELAGGAS